MILFLTGHIFQTELKFSSQVNFVKGGESGTNNLLDQQIRKNLQRLLVWRSGDDDGFQSQWSGVQVQLSGK